MFAGSLERSTKSVRGLLAIFLIASSCNRSTRDDTTNGFTESANQAKQDAAVWTPLETVRYVHTYRLGGQITLLEKHLLPDQRAQVIELIHAVDALMLANKVLCEKIDGRFGPATAESFDRSFMADQVGVLSTNVDALAEKIDGDRAVVTIQVGNQLPVQEVQLLRRDDRWIIQTDPPIPELAAEIRQLSVIWREIADSLDKSPLTVAELRSELTARQSAIARRLAINTKTAEN